MSSHIIDVAIGMVFVYLILSLICTVVNEVIAGVFTMRAKTLELGIKSLFSEDAAGVSVDKSFTNLIYSHPLVRGLYAGVERKAAGLTEDVQRTWNSRVNLPSYIPAGTFATALIDSIAPGAGGPNVFDQVKTAIQALPNSTTKNALLSLTLTADGKLESFQTNVEGWFNASMDRASGWYKRQTKKTLTVIALLVTILANADSVQVAKRLWNDPAFREQMVQAAQKYTSSNPTATPTQTTSISGLEKMLPDTLPIGWGPSSGFSWTTLLGWLFTALALTLGAPFWFDVLNKFMVVRSTVKPKEKAGKDTKG
jgi:hypothetical protein